MLEQWEKHECWVAHFDILGFKSLLEKGSMEFEPVLSQSKIDDILNHIENISPLYREQIDYLFYADTFIFYSKSDQALDYSLIICVAQRFIRECIYIKLPVRGAISFGELIFGHEKKILMGNAFLESYEYSEDQNWLGLLLTPTATKKVSEYPRINPLNHYFCIDRDIPLKHLSTYNQYVFAYTFCDGPANYSNPLLGDLEEMLKTAPDAAKV
ncbi:MAG: hypothetical protein ABR991_03010, partial [Terracidiphilus sp.]